MRRTLHRAAPQQASSQPMERLATRSLLLEPLTLADYAWVVDLYSDAEVMRYIGNGPRPETETRNRLDWFLDQAKHLGFGYWVMRDRATGEPLGGAMLMVRSPGSKIELGFALARASWGRGLATEAAQALVDHAFDRIGVPELEAFTHQENTASGAVLRKAGMRDTGLSTGPYGHVDRRYAITREEWRPLPSR
jgi:RimJ/RimL family protein N-acetyltransferase